MANIIIIANGPAGDCTGGLLQISKAMYEGAKVGTEIIKYLRNNSNKISA